MCLGWLSKDVPMDADKRDGLSSECTLYLHCCWVSVPSLHVSAALVRVMNVWHQLW